MDNELEALVSKQCEELMAARDTESDLDLAFRLQIQEAMAASLALQPSSSSSPPSHPPPLPEPDKDVDDDDVSHILAFQTLELDRFHQEKKDSDHCQAEMRRISDDLRRRAHDESFAREIDRMPDDDWDDYGDDFEQPIEEDEQPFRVYFKGMSSMHFVNGVLVQLTAVGVAVCDPQDKLVLKIQKPLSGVETCREVLETRALIEGLNAAISLGIKKVDVFCDYRALHHHVIGKWAVKQRKVVNLINQVTLLQRKLETCRMFLVARCHIKFAFKLAREAINSQITKKAELNRDKNLKETCSICLEDTDSSEMFAVDGCLHRFCFSCMKQHVEVKLLHGMLPGCPYDGCNTRLNVESSRTFLSSKLLEIMVQRLKEASIPAAERIYCPYPKCSALMSRSETICPQQHSSSQKYIKDTSGLRKCIKCNGLFCITCKIPWHDRISCYDYKKLNPHPRAEDAKLQSLATQKLWRRCVRCNHMIELAEGCFHMTCRCGFEFCYTCGAEWRDKKATCSCPLWDEGYIWHDDSDDEDSEDFDDDYDDDYSEDEDYDADTVYGRHYL